MIYVAVRFDRYFADAEPGEILANVGTTELLSLHIDLDTALATCKNHMEKLYEEDRQADTTLAEVSLEEYIEMRSDYIVYTVIEKELLP